jgi:hypothetical protein
MVRSNDEGNVTSQGVIKTANEITNEWLGSVLGAEGLELDGVETIGTGQMSRVYRVSYRRPGGEPESVAVKLAATDQNSREVGVNLGAYLREITFYRELRDRIGGDGTLAECHLATHDPKEGWFTLVLEDIEDGVQGDQIAGCGQAEARIAMVALARIHAPVFALAVRARRRQHRDRRLEAMLLDLGGLRFGPTPELSEVDSRRFVAQRPFQRDPQRPLSRDPEVQALELEQPAERRVAGHLAVQLQAPELLGQPGPAGLQRIGRDPQFPHQPLESLAVRVDLTDQTV